MKRLHYLLLAITLALSVAGCLSNSSGGENAIGQKCSAEEVSEERIERGDPAAIAQAIASLKCLDGGNLEDRYRSLGVAFAKQPSIVAEQIQRTRVTTALALPMFTMLPLSFVDDPCASEQELIRRAKFVSATELDTNQKLAFLAAINESIARERKHCNVE